MDPLNFKKSTKKETLLKEKKQGQAIMQLLKQPKKENGNVPIIPEANWLS